MSAKIVRSLFGAGEHLSPYITGRAAFELFCRTTGRAALSERERRLLGQAEGFMADARRHWLTTRFGRVMAYDFRPSIGRPRQTVLVVHGWQSRAEHMKVVIGEFRKAGYRVIALDLPGHGRSSGRRLNLAIAVDAVRVAADWFGPFATVVGHSFGGAVALNAIAGSITGLAPIEAGRLVMIAAPSSIPALFADFGNVVHLGPRSQVAMERQVERVAGRPLEAFIGAEQLARLDIPTLVIHAPDDREVSADNATAFARAGGHVQLRWADGLGHRRILADPAIAAEAVRFSLALTGRSAAA